MTMMDDLLAALRELFDGYPTDAPDQIAGALMLVDPAGAERGPLLPIQARRQQDQA